MSKLKEVQEFIKRDAAKQKAVATLIAAAEASKIADALDTLRGLARDIEIASDGTRAFAPMKRAVKAAQKTLAQVQKSIGKPESVWVVMYTHRHGVDLFTYSTKAKANAAAKALEADPDFEGADGGEFVEVTESEIDSNYGSN